GVVGLPRLLARPRLALGPPGPGAAGAPPALGVAVVGAGRRPTPPTQRLGSPLRGARTGTGAVPLGGRLDLPAPLRGACPRPHAARAARLGPGGPDPGTRAPARPPA